MAKTFLPTFQYGTGNQLSSPEEIAKYLIIFFFHNPGEMSDLTEGLLSWQHLAAEYDQNIDGMVAILRQQLQTILDRYFPTDGYQVDVGYRRQSGSVLYTITIAILKPDGTPLINASSIEIGTDNTIIQITDE